MTEIEAKKIIKGKLACMTKCGVFEREQHINSMNCDNCSYCYEQGNFGQQKEALQVAINALEKMENIKTVIKDKRKQYREGWEEIEQIVKE